MRLHLKYALLGLCLLAAYARHPSLLGSLRAEERHVGFVSRSSQLEFDKSIEGFGQTDDDARARVLENACDAVGRFMEERGDTGYRPSLRQLQDLKIVPPMKDIAVTEQKFKKLDEPMQVATVRVRVMQDQFKIMQTEARQQRASERQHWMSLGLASVVALLLVGIGYLRLEEATKGFYTGVLRATALAILALVGMVMVYLIRSTSV